MFLQDAEPQSFCFEDGAEASQWGELEHIARWLVRQNFMIPNSAPQKWCGKFLSQQSQQKPSRAAFMVLSVSKGRLNKFCLLLLLVPSVRLNSSFSTSVIGLAAVIFLFFPLHLFVFLKNQEFEQHNQVKFILSTLRVDGKSQRNM